MERTIINHGLTPKDIQAGKDRIYVDGPVVMISEPTFLTLPSPYKETLEKKWGHPVDRINVVRISKTPIGCPYGVGLKVYVLEHDLICIATPKQFLWMQATANDLKKLGV